MSIKIDIQKPEIPVEIGGLSFTYDYSDKSLTDESKQAEELLNKMRSMDDNTNADEINKQFEIGFDMYLGEGAYKQIYELSPSILETVRIFIELRNHLEDELTKRGELIKKTQQDRAKKYTKKKK